MRQYAASIAALPDTKNTARGIAVGEAAAADIEALRANDGRNAASPAPTVGTPTNPVQAGVWVWPPAPSLQIDQTPWMAVMQPFMLESTSQFRAPPPNALTSTQYTTDFNELEASGSNLPANDPRRDTAWFWNANVISQLNRTLEDFATQNNMDLLDTVRLLAMGNMVPTDAGMACFDSKYTYRFWRPITAIRNADIDGNPATTADTTWSPLTATPNHPEYPSQHGCATSALAQVLAHAVGTDEIDATIWGATAATPTGLVTSRVFPTVQTLDGRARQRSRLDRLPLPQLRDRGREPRHLGRELGATALLPADQRRGRLAGSHRMGRPIAAPHRFVKTARRPIRLGSY